MATINVVLNNTNWQDVEDLIDDSLVADQDYAITIKGGYRGEVCTAASTPDNSFYGHPLTANENFNYKHKSGDKLYVKAHCVGATLIIT